MLILTFIILTAGCATGALGCTAFPAEGSNGSLLTFVPEAVSAIGHSSALMLTR